MKINKCLSVDLEAYMIIQEKVSNMSKLVSDFLVEYSQLPLNEEETQDQKEKIIAIQRKQIEKLEEDLKKSKTKGMKEIIL